MSTEEPVAVEKHICSSCGGPLSFAPGTTSMQCPFCGRLEAFEATLIKVAPVESDYEGALSFLEEDAATAPLLDSNVVNCQKCGAATAVGAEVLAEYCPFCGASISALSAVHASIAKPQYLMPFAFDNKAASGYFSQWVKKLWLAPSKLKKQSGQSKFSGVYLPFYTFDSDTGITYAGKRGVYYYTTRTYRVTENGKQVFRTESVRNTRWDDVSGEVDHFFDDVLVPVTKSLDRKKLNALEPWALDGLVPFNEKYLQGFRAEVSTFSLRQGFSFVQQEIEEMVDVLVKNDIGGNEQRVTSTNISYTNIRYKSILLPVWLSTYTFKDKFYRFMINATTGEVIGERPYSWIKITFVVLVAVALLWGIIEKFII